MDHEPVRLSTWGTDPRVVGALVDGRRAAEQVATRLAADHPGTAFITVLAVPSLDDLGVVLDALAPVSAERVFADVDQDSGADGHALATAALEVHGVGQDFVVEVPTVADAVRLGLRALSPSADVPWDGTALLVAGGADVLDQARRALAAGIPPAAP